MKNILLLLTTAICISSCTVEIETGGCLDSYADNYNANVDYNDGSCLYTCMDPYATNYTLTSGYDICDYEASVVFFLDEAASDYFTILGIPFLDIYIGNDRQDPPLNTGLYIEGTPNCIDDYGSAAVQFDVLWENSHDATFTWSVRDLSGVVHYDNTNSILANNCLPMELTWKKIQEYKEATK